MSGEAWLERLRQRIRSVLGYDSLVYRTMAGAINQSLLLLREGPRSAFLINRLKRSEGSASAPVAVKLRRLEHPIYVRPGTNDCETVVNNIVREEYGQLSLAPQGPHFIVDAGAYIGDTSAYFINRYPGSTIVALEPNPASFSMAKQNLAPYGNRVVLVEKALWVQRTTLRVSGLETGARVSGSGDTNVETMTISDLLKLSPSGRITLLKLDIEGGEEQLFSEEPESWLPEVDNIIIETHGAGIERLVLQVLDRAGWGALRHRNLYYCRRLGGV